MRNKRFWFASWAITCVSVVTVIQNVAIGDYKIMILAIVAGYLGAQSITDHGKKKVNNA